MKRVPALFLDRDGVINKEKNYLYKIDDFEFIDGVFEVCRHYKQLGYKIIIITNQAGIARGYYTKEDFEKLTTWMLKQFKYENIEIDGIYYCPHHPKGNIPVFSKECSCRKPKPGLLLQAKKDHGIDVSKSILVGDKVSDIGAGRNAGIKTNILVESGHTLNDQDKQEADFTIKVITELLTAYKIK